MILFGGHTAPTNNAVKGFEYSFIEEEKDDEEEAQIGRASEKEESESR